jgi:hypothetical protein
MKRGNTKTDRYIAENYERYELSVAGRKFSPSSPIVVSERKKNHPSSLHKNQPVVHESLPDSMNIIIEIKEFENKFSINLDSQGFPDCILFRYDSGGGTHRNNFPNIPLGEQSVTTPHFHKYNKEGYCIAYKTEKLKLEKEAEALCDIQFGFPYFCQESNIRYNNDLPELKIISGNLFPENEIDPLENITFA